MSHIDNKQIKLNFSFSILSLIINMAVALLYTPYLVNELGIAAYGIIPLALLVNQYIGVLTDSLTASFTRFYIISVQTEKWEEASSYLSTSFFVVILLIFFSIIPSVFFINKLEDIFNIPKLYFNSAKYLFIFTLISFFISLASSFFNIILLAYNRVDLMSIIKVIRGLLKPLIVILLFYFKKDILFVGLANLVGEVFVLIFSIYFFFLFSNQKVQLRISYINRGTLYSIMLMSFWVIIQNIGDVGLFRLDSFVINRLWTTTESGIIGALGELGGYINIVGFTLINIIVPIILIAYSKRDYEKVKEITLNNSLNIGLLFAVLIGVLIGFSDKFIEIWFRNQAIKESNIWLAIKFSIIPFYLSSGFFVSANRADNFVKKPAIFTMILGFINITLILISIKFYPKLSVKTILLFCLLFGTVQCYFLNGYYFTLNYKNVAKVVMVNFFKILFTLIVISLLSYVFNVFVLNDINIIWLIMFLLVYTILLLIFVFSFLVAKDQRRTILKMIYKK